MDRKKIIIIVAIAVLILGIIIAVSNSKTEESPADVVASALPTQEEMIVSEEQVSETVDETKEYLKEDLTDIAFRIKDEIGFSCSYPKEFEDLTDFVYYVNPQTNILEEVKVVFKESRYPIFSFMIINNSDEQKVNSVKIDEYQVYIKLGYEANPFNEQGPRINQIRNFGKIAINYIRKADFEKEQIAGGDVITTIEQTTKPNKIEDIPTVPNTNNSNKNTTGSNGIVVPEEPTTLMPIFPSTTSAHNGKYPIPKDGKYKYYEVKNGEIIISLEDAVFAGIIDATDVKYFVGRAIDGDGYTIYCFNLPTGTMLINANQVLYDLGVLH